MVNFVFCAVPSIVLPVIMTAVSCAAGAACIAFAVQLIKRQVKLSNSITLVELKSTKLHYAIFALAVAFFFVYVIFQMIDAGAPEIILLNEYFGMPRWQALWMLGFLAFLLLCAEFLLAVLLKCRGGVVDRGVYTAVRYLQWYHVHDYIIDEEKCVVILTADKDTFKTLKGTTPPLKVAKNDIPKLKFILNKNKNKFSGF
mgnify:CR=1 FL=1